MPDIAALLNDLVCKRIDFPTCVATYPELTRDEQMRLLIAEQSVRKVDGQPCDLEHYEIILSWLSTEPESQLRVIENEFLLSLGRGAAPSEVVQEFETRYSRFGSLLRERLEAVEIGRAHV